MDRRAPPNSDGLRKWAEMTSACLDIMRAAIRAEHPRASERTVRILVAKRLQAQRAETLKAYREHA
jgi:hypothetical protein